MGLCTTMQHDGGNMVFYPLRSNTAVATPYVRLSWARSGRRGKAATPTVITAALQSFSPQQIAFPECGGLAFVTFLTNAEAVALLHASPLAPDELRGLRLFAESVNAVRISDLMREQLAGRPWSGPVPAAVNTYALPGLPGLLLVHNFTTDDEEEELLRQVNSSSWDSTMGRCVQHYGSSFDYVTRRAIIRSDTDISTSLLTGAIARIGARIQTLGVFGEDGNKTLSVLAMNVALSNEVALDDALENQSRSRHCTVWPAADQATVNKYERGQGIASHVDTHSSFEDGIAVVSLLGGVVMDFTRVATEDRPTDTTLYCASSSSSTAAAAAAAGQLAAEAKASASVWLPPRSLLIMRGEARFAWAHAIAARNTDNIDGCLQPRTAHRISITFRRIRRMAPSIDSTSSAESAPSTCACAWPSVCVSRAGTGGAPDELVSPALQRSSLAPNPASAQDAAGAAAISPQLSSIHQVPQLLPTCPITAPPVEALHVHALYDAIATHFSATRHTAWPRVDAFVRSLPAGSLLLDVGCGNGKYLGGAASAHLAALGIERSAPLARICGSRGFSAAVADCVARLPVRRGIWDAVLSVAVLHHLSTRDRRVRAVAQLLAAASPTGGLVLVQSWALEQGSTSRRAFSGGGDALVPWSVPRAWLDGDDASISAAGGTLDALRGVVVFQRFVHAHGRGELESLVVDADALLEAEARARSLEYEPAKVLESWWDRDNWCIIVKRGGSPNQVTAPTCRDGTRPANEETAMLVPKETAS